MRCHAFVWPAYVLAVVSLGGCSFAPYDLEGRRCPCAPGYECVADICVASTGMDAAVDAAERDVTAPDATSDTPVANDAALDAPTTDIGPDAPADAPTTDVGTCHEQTLEILGAADDGFLDALGAGVWFPHEGGLIHCGAWDDGGAYPVWCHLRFAVEEAIPAGAGSLQATLTMATTGGMAWDDTSDALVVHFERTHAAMVVTSAADATSRLSDLTPGIRWPTSGGLSWPALGSRTTPELASILDAVGLPLAPGDHLQIWIGPASGVADAFVRSPAYAPADFTSPVLTLRWCD